MKAIKSDLMFCLCARTFYTSHLNVLRNSTSLRWYLNIHPALICVCGVFVYMYIAFPPRHLICLSFPIRNVEMNIDLASVSLLQISRLNMNQNDLRGITQSGEMIDGIKPDLMFIISRSLKK